MLIVCNGMIRSGSTLQFNICKELISWKTDNYIIGFYPDDVPEGFYSHQGVKVLKSHKPYLSGNGTEAVKTLYIYRDLRDVYLSLKRKLKCDQSHCFNMIDEALDDYAQIVSSSNVLLQKYENVYEDLTYSIEEVAKFIECDFTKEKILEMSQKLNVDSLVNSKERKKFKFTDRIKILANKLGIKRFNIYDENSYLHYNHFSIDRGAVGSWKENLSESEISQINHRYQEWLEGHGYEVY